MNCKYFGVCGGCDLLNQKYENQLVLKTNYVKNLFKNAKINANISNAYGMKYPFAYRNKLHLAFSEYKGKVSVGFYKKNSKQVVDIDDCIMHDKWARDLISIVKKYIKDFKIPIYDTHKRSGTLRYIVARNYEDSIVVALVVSKTMIAGKDILYKTLKEKFQKVSLYLNVNTRTDSAVFGDKFIYVKGEKGLIVDFMGVKFTLSPSSFMQVNLSTSKIIYDEVINTISKNKSEVVLDLFSGVGITSLIFAKNGANVVSIESEKSSYYDAVKLQKLNNLQDKITCVCGKCEDHISGVCEKFRDKSISVFLDPPRSGSQKIVLDSILKIRPTQIVYLSCNCETLVRDLKVILKDKNYKIDFVKPYDMFPHTYHIEVLVSLRRIDRLN